ncbi:kinase suppressor of Ras 1-like isoform X3 [Bolinopsis microptera]|uniref:kinase suppressor of Ras 1-like isoform X3 n=1 Tax=Bolinopsis microptera TaxID=2820187 RepID=UPI00307B01CF
MATRMSNSVASDVSQVKQVIKIIADKLITIRDQHISTELGLDECRSLENKIIKYYCRIILMMENAPDDDDKNTYMDFSQLLKVIGIHDDGIEEISKSETLIDILDLDDSQTAGFAQKYALHREETRKFCLFLHNLRRCVHDRKSNKEGLNNYVWQSWNKIPRYHSTSSMDRLALPGNLPRSQSYSLSNANLLNKVVNKSQPNLSNVVNMECLNQYSSVPRNTSKSGTKKPRPSVLNLPCFMYPPSPSLNSPIVMAHSIKHRFSSRSLLLSQNCDFCHKMMLFRYGVRCKECNYKCHKDCSLKAPASCGLPPQLEEFYKRQCELSQTQRSSTVQAALSPSAQNISTPASPGLGPINTPPLTPPASAPCSSKNKQRLVHKIGVPKSSNYTMKELTISSSPQHFTFPDQCQSTHGTTGNIMSSTTGNMMNQSPPASGNMLNQSPPFEGGSKSLPPGVSPGTPTAHAPAYSSPYQSHTKKTTAMATVNVTPSVSSPSVDMEDVTMTIKPVFDMEEDDESEEISEHEEEDEEFDELGTEQPKQNTLPTRKRFLRKSVISDWGINFEELIIGKKIGDGRTGQVYEGKWHGDVVIKIYHIPHPTKEQLAQFRREVQMLRKVRHENIVLFMGVCMNPPNLCIVTEYIKGKSLHFYIHERGKAYTERQSMQIMEQVSAALGYLHHRGIIHKNLKSKNIHLNDKKAVICDFGLGSMTDLKLKKGEKGFEVLFNVNLYYLAPEIIRKLQAVVAGKEKGEIELSESTDVYALGTVWYEILAGHWPWPGHSPEQVWWHLSKGLVPDVSSSSADMSRLLLSCWTNDPHSRPNAAQLAKDIRALPLPRALQRSPSHPVGLKRTATS